MKPSIAGRSNLGTTSETGHTGVGAEYTDRFFVVPHAEWHKHIACPHYLKPSERQFQKLSLESSATHEESSLQSSLLIFMMDGEASVHIRRGGEIR